MTWAEWSGPLAYLGVFVATVVEGEVVFVAATVLVHTGHLSGAGVYTAATLGGSIGDQIYFYALRGRLRGWLDRFPTWAKRRDRIIARVRRNASAMILACRFLPGLRVAIPAACAYAGVPPVRFSVLSLVSSLAWAAAVMGLIVWIGPTSFAQLGVRGWWTPLIPAALVIAFTYWLARAEKQAETRDSGPDAPWAAGDSGAG
jgi:membrane protein DedA with SNARE-associated domain